jgi:uncharacterized protein (UPF0332 family)
MEPWQQWWNMAMESLEAASTLKANGLWRSSVSRYYYAAYQATSAVLLYRGIPPPADEEAWSHADTPNMLEAHFTPYVSSRDTRKRLKKQLGELYKWRILADYRGGEKSESRMGNVRKYASYIVKTAEDILPKET